MVVRWALGAALAMRSAIGSGTRCAKSYSKVVPEEGGNDDRFGASVANVGDIDGDGVDDLGVGAPGDNHGSFELTNNAGAVYFVLRAADGSAKRVVKSVVDKGQKNDWYGSSLAAIGDLDGDGRSEIGVGAPYWDEKGRVDSGAFFVYSLSSDASVASSGMFSAKSHGSTHLATSDNFGASLAGVGDVDGDGIPDVVVGAHKYDDAATGEENVGCVYLCYMTSKLQPRACVRLGPKSSSRFGTAYPSTTFFGRRRQTDGLASSPPRARAAIHPSMPLHRSLRSNDYFGVALASLGKTDAGANRLLVGASGDDDGGSRSGAVYVLDFDSSGVVSKYHKVSATDATLGLRAGDHFGASIVADGAGSVYVGADSARNADQLGAGAVFLLRFDGETVADAVRVDSVTGGGPALDGNDRFGSSVALVGDELVTRGVAPPPEGGFTVPSHLVESRLRATESNTRA